MSHPWFNPDNYRGTRHKMGWPNFLSYMLLNKTHLLYASLLLYFT